MTDAPRVGLVVVSHSRALADAAVELAREMAPGEAVRIEVAAGVADGDATAYGTDAAAIAEAVQRADTGAGTVVLMDLGSAVLSAELALELVDPALAGRTLLCPAPLVEGLVVAAVTTAGGAGREEVAAEAAAALDAKRAAVGDPGPGRDVPAGTSRGVPAGTSDPVSGTFRVADPHGLHARPAARLVAAARGLDADVVLANATTGAGPAPARSLTRVAALAALAGHEVEVRASGPAAAEAVARLVAVGAEAPPAAGSEPSLAAGAGGAGAGGAEGRALPASAGSAVGAVWRPSQPPLDASVERPGAPREQAERLRAAVEAARAATVRLRDQTARSGGTAAGDEAAVFDAHLALLDDPDLHDAARARIDVGATDAAAWATAVDDVALQWAAVPDPYLAARAADVRAVGDAVLRALLGVAADPLPSAPPEGGRPTAVVVADDLTPAVATALDPGAVAGIVLAGSSATGHAMLLARARGVPAVVGAGPAVLDLEPGTPIALDGATGELVVEPTPEVARRFRAAADAARVARDRARARATEPARTRDGVRVEVAANVATVEDAAAASAAGADSSGLVRTELLLGRLVADRTTPPDVEEQAAAYLSVAEALGGRRIVIRTLDVGGDKPLPWAPVAREENPFLGLRGLRLQLARPQLLEAQLRAVVRTARRTPVTVMFPMVATLPELRAAQEALDAAVTAEGGARPRGLQVGIMVEVPAAALKARTLAPHVDLLSIGTNDLTQYALAAERGNPAVAALGDPLDPAVLALIGLVARAAADVPRSPLVAVCGDLASDPAAVPLLLALGVRELSVAPAVLPEVKDAVRATEVSAWRGRVGELLELADAEAVRAALRT